MNRFSTIILVLLISLSSGCEKEENTDPNYPATVIEKESDEIWALVDELALTPLSGCTAVDTFGFCFIDTKIEGCNLSELPDSNLLLPEIEALFEQGLINYGSFLNITDPLQVSIQSVKTLSGTTYETFITGYPDSVNANWMVSTGLQKFNDIPVRGTRLQMLVSGHEVVAIGGRRFTNIYIPEKDLFSAEMARESLLGEELTYKRSTYKITSETYWYDYQKSIVPVYLSGKIELRVCWILYPETWEVVVDSQSGKILSSVNISSL
ncbi:MAG: hypothetical protein K9H26_07950 [Prolixibacteraceae bacterium]|nr:hypothetical protein [Prolixibacteraceae bacterium]